MGDTRYPPARLGMPQLSWPGSSCLRGGRDRQHCAGTGDTCAGSQLIAGRPLPATSPLNSIAARSSIYVTGFRVWKAYPLLREWAFAFRRGGTTRRSSSAQGKCMHLSPCASMVVLVQGGIVGSLLFSLLPYLATRRSCALGCATVMIGCSSPRPFSTGLVLLGGIKRLRCGRHILLVTLGPGPSGWVLRGMTWSRRSRSRRR